MKSQAKWREFRPIIVWLSRDMIVHTYISTAVESSCYIMLIKRENSSRKQPIRFTRLTDKISAVNMYQPSQVLILK